VIIGASSGPGFIFIIIIAFLLLYLIVVRPQKRRQTQQQQMMNELRVGDEVLTAGGIYGTISRVDDDQITVEIAPKTEVRVARRAIAGVTSEPDPAEEGESEEPQDDDGERWQSAFDEHGSEAGDTSIEEKRG
jgi:preprotein translocase subunit YajC